MILDELDDMYWALWIMFIVWLLIITIPVCIAIYRISHAILLSLRNNRIVKDNGILPEVLYCPVIRLGTENNEGIFYSHRGQDYLYAFQSEVEAIVFVATQKAEGKGDTAVEERPKIKLESDHIYFKPVQRDFILVKR